MVKSFYQWDAEPIRDGPYDLLQGFKQALCLTESGPTLNVDTTITRFYPHSDLLTFIWERLLMQDRTSFQGRLLDRQYDQISNHLKDIEVTTVQSDHQKKYVLTGHFSDHLPGQTPMNEQENLLDYYKHLGFELRYPQLYCFKAYRLGNSQHIIDLPIELCYFREWQQVKEDENTKPVPAPPVNERFNSILEAIRNCNFHDNQLCKEIQLEVNCEGMMTIHYETLRKRQIISRQGGFTNPISIDQMGFIYLADRQQQYARQIQEKLLNNFYEVSIIFFSLYLRKSFVNRLQIDKECNYQRILMNMKFLIIEIWKTNFVIDYLSSKANNVNSFFALKTVEIQRYMNYSNELHIQNLVISLFLSNVERF